MKFTAQQIADFLQGEVVGNKDVAVGDFAKIEEGRPGTLTFLSNPKYAHFIYTTKADVVLVDKTFVPEQPISATLIKVDSAYQSLAKLLQLADSVKPKLVGISPLAYVAPTAKIGKDVFLAPFAAVADGAEIGDGAQLHPHATVGMNAKVGAGTIMYSNSVVYHDCKVGARCILHGGCVIGADGFGFAPDAEGKYNKIPQLGIVQIDDDVEVGANTTIDRAVMGATHIHQGVKIDNLCQIAHNVEVGEHTAMAAQTGIAGSAKIGKHCVLAGQVGVAGHITIADGSVFGAKTGISGSITEGGQQWQGFPIMPAAKFRRAAAAQRQLPDLVRRINELEKQLAKLQENK